MADDKTVIDGLNEIARQVKELKVFKGSQFVPVLTAIVTLFIAVFSWWNNRDIEEIKKKVEIEHTRISDRQAEAAMGANIYREVFLALSESNDRKKKSMLDLLHAIEAEYRADEERQSMRLYMKQLQDLFKNSTDQEVKDRANFYAEDSVIAFRSSQTERPKANSVQTLLPPPPTATSQDSGTIVARGRQDGWDYDVFWCEESPTNQQLATVIFDGLRARQESEKLGRLRLRRLPTAIQQSAGYGIEKQVVIRRHISKDEQAQKLRDEIIQDLKSAQRNVAVDIGESAQRLPWYLSVFVCL